MSPRTVLAIDGGNSKTDLVVIDEHGSVLSRVRTGPFIPHLVGAVEAVALIAAGVAEAFADAGVSRVSLVAGYLANVDLPVHEREMHDALVDRNWADAVIAENDTLAMLRTGTSSSVGVAVVCGAGVNGVGVGPNGDRVRFGALGRITGDWGGGLGISKEVLWHTSRAEDGRGEPTALSQAVAAHFGRANATEVAEAVHLREIDADAIHEIVPVLFATAAAGDHIAVGLVNRQAQELALLATTAITRLGLEGTAVEVVVGGGMLTAPSSPLTAPFTERVRAVAPRAEIRIVDEPPILGACLLGLDELHGDSDSFSAAERTLRAGLARVSA